LKNDIKKIVSLKDIPVGKFEDIIEQTMLISPNIMPSIVENQDVCHGLDDMLYLSTGYYLPGGGATSHPHENIDIVTLALSGNITYSGSVDDGKSITESQVQVQRAGSGIQHSEKNTSSENARFIQMWFSAPSFKQEPTFQTINLQEEGLTTVLGGGDADDTFNSLMTCKIGSLKKDESLSYERDCILFIIKGSIQCGNTEILEGQLTKINNLDIVASQDTQLVFVFSNDYS
jgi:redox-sensitive bicupin YhaK (pirin superfamily)